MLDALVTSLKSSLLQTVVTSQWLRYQLPYGHGTVCTKEEMLTGFCGVKTGMSDWHSPERIQMNFLKLSKLTF